VTDRLRAVPAWGWLVLVVAASFALRAWLARAMVAPFIMVDELIYAELARSFAEEGRLLVRGASEAGYGVVYPVLISPAYALFDSLVDAYGAVKTLNALLMSLAALPAYALARRVVSPGLALLAAVLAVAVPSLAYTGTVMTENAFYPLFLVAVLALVRVLERPSAPRVLILAAAVAVAFATRQQALALVPAILGAPVVLAALRGRWRETLRPFAPACGLVLGLAAAVLVAQALRGRSFRDLLGAYGVVAEADRYDPGRALAFLLYHWAELALYVGFVPVAAVLVLAALGRTLDARLQELLAATLAVSFAVVLVVAVFASRFADRIQERNTFYVAPLFLTLLLAWVARGAPRPPRVAVPAAALAALAALAIPFERFVGDPSRSDSLMLLPWWSVQDRIGLEWVAELAFLCACAAATAFLLVPRRWALALPLAVLAYFALVTKPIWSGTHGLVQSSRGALFQGIRSQERDWVDRRAGDERAAVLWTDRADRFGVNLAEFFNRSVGPLYYTERGTPGLEGSETRVRLGRDGVARDERGRTIDEPLLLTDAPLDLAGRRLADDAALMSLWRVDPPVRSLSLVEGLYEGDTWSGPSVTWRRRECTGGRLEVSLSSDGTLFRWPQRVTADTGASVVLPPGGTARLVVPVRARNGQCVARFTIAPTAVPADVIPGSTDPRRLGAHFDGFRYIPPR
jgi:4-amino-4-deoxy-L-arabinose transferase-like glycosyltransferase